MSLQSLAQRLRTQAVSNSPAILTAVGVVGTISTAYLASKASIKAVDLIRLEEEFKQRPLEPREKVEAVWQIYIPPAISGTVTITAIVMANRVSSSRVTALAAAYSISDRAFTEYKEKVVEKLGEKKEQVIHDELAQERVLNNPPSDGAIVITGNGDVMCYDHLTGRYFYSSMETLRQSENQINFRIINDGYASLSDLYDLWGLKPTTFSDDVGWNTDRPLKIVYSTTLSEDSRPCLAVDFDIRPYDKYSQFSG